MFVNFSLILRSNGEGKLRLLTSSARPTVLTASTTAGGGAGAAGGAADRGGTTLMLVGLLLPFLVSTITADGAALLDEVGGGGE